MTDHPPAVRRVIAVLDELGPQVAVLSALEVAERAAVSDATVIRTARLLGHAGFDDLKQAAVSDDWPQRAQSFLDAERADDGAAGRLADAARALDHAAGAALPHLAAAVDVLDDAGEVLVGAVGPTAGMAETMATLLRRAGLPAEATADSGRSLADRLVTVRSTTVLVLLSFADRHPQLAAFQACAAETPCPLLVIGSPPPDGLGAPVTVPVGRGATTTLATLVPTLAVVETVVAELMRRRPKRSRGAADRLDLLRQAARLART
ncbi:MAG: hypothetical protein AAF962_16400 [Actinomycetota bacterium]